MAKKTKNKIEKCNDCKYKDGLICKHESNKGVIVKYRVETPVYFKTCLELSESCKNYVKFSAK